jgi:hypothetical protein
MSLMSPRHAVPGQSQTCHLPPTRRASFQRTVEKLTAFVERLSLRNEQRQGERFVVTYAKPLLEAPEPGEDYGYLESPPTGLEL